MDQIPKIIFTGDESGYFAKTNKAGEIKVSKLFENAPDPVKGAIYNHELGHINLGHHQLKRNTLSKAEQLQLEFAADTFARKQGTDITGALKYVIDSNNSPHGKDILKRRLRRQQLGSLDKLLTKRNALIGVGAVAGIGILKSLLSSKEKWNPIDGLHPNSEGMGASSVRSHSSFGSGHKGILDANLEEEIWADKKIEAEEYRKYIKKLKLAQDNEMAMMVLKGKTARKVLDNEIFWRNPANLSKVDAGFVERETIGSFGSYQPNEKKLNIGAILDPNDVIAYADAATKPGSIGGSTIGTNSLLGFISPNRAKETTLHEGLHAVWDLDIDPKDKEAYYNEALRQLDQDPSKIDRSTDILNIAAKHPVYMQQAVMGNITVRQGYKEDNPYVEWMANEMFAHRGALKVYSDLGYELPDNKELDKIVQSYIRWGKGKKRRKVAPDLIQVADYGQIVDSELSLDDRMEAKRDAGKMATPEGTRVQFNRAINPIEGLHPGSEGLGTQTLREHSEFGSGYQGPKESSIGDKVSTAMGWGFNAAFVGGAAVTGRDRFGLKGAAVGGAMGAAWLGATSGIQYLLGEESTAGKIFGSVTGGITGSAFTSMIASSMMKGGTFQAAGKKVSKGFSSLVGNSTKSFLKTGSGKSYLKAQGKTAEQATSDLTGFLDRTVDDPRGLFAVVQESGEVLKDLGSFMVKGKDVGFKDRATGGLLKSLTNPYVQGFLGSPKLAGAIKKEGLRPGFDRFAKKNLSNLGEFTEKEAASIVSKEGKLNTAAFKDITNKKFRAKAAHADPANVAKKIDIERQSMKNKTETPEGMVDYVKGIEEPKIKDLNKRMDDILKQRMNNKVAYGSQEYRKLGDELSNLEKESYEAHSNIRNVELGSRYQPMTTRSTIHNKFEKEAKKKVKAAEGFSADIRKGREALDELHSKSDSELETAFLDYSEGLKDISKKSYFNKNAEDLYYGSAGGIAVGVVGGALGFGFDAAFGKSNKALNETEGLHPGASNSMGAQSIRKHSEFGSGYQGMANVLFKAGTKVGTKVGIKSVKKARNKFIVKSGKQHIVILEGDRDTHSKTKKFNKIDGLHPGASNSLGAKSIRKHSEFGSGYQGSKRTEDSLESNIKSALPWIGLAAAAVITPIGIKAGRSLLKGGRTRLYHGTSKAGGEGIRKMGLSSSESLKKGSITDDFLNHARYANRFSAEEEEAFKGLVYLTGNPVQARSYSTTAELMTQGKKLAQAQAEVRANPNDLYNPFSKGKGDMVSFDVPLWKDPFKSNITRNPEVAKFKDWKEFKQSKLQTKLKDSQIKAVYKGLNSSTVLRTDVGTEFISNNKTYLKELPEYFKANTGEALGKVGKTAAPIILAGASVASMFASEGLHPGASNSMGAQSIRKHSEFGSGYQGRKVIPPDAPRSSITQEQWDKIMEASNGQGVMLVRRKKVLKEKDISKKEEISKEEAGVGSFLSFLNSAFMVGAAGLTGYDRFGVKGAIGGAAVGAAIELGTSALSVDNTDNSLGGTLWNGAIEGFKSSAGMSLIASSFMKGATLGKMFNNSNSGKQIIEAVGKEIGQDVAEAGGMYAAQARAMSMQAESFMSKFLGKKAGKVIGRGLESNMGSPSMLDSVLKHGNIKNIPALEYAMSNVKDVAMGTAAGVVISSPISIAVSLLSGGSNKALNEIEGLHPNSNGMGAKSIQGMTDFGSGWKGMANTLSKIGKVFGFGAKVESKELRILKELRKGKTIDNVIRDAGFDVFEKNDDSIKEFASRMLKSLGKKEKHLEAVSSGIKNAPYPQGSFRGGGVLAGTEDYYASKAKEIIASNNKFAKFSTEDIASKFREVSLMHEYLEVEATKSIAGKFGKGNIPSLKFGSHASKSIISKEIKYAQAMGNDHFEILKTIRYMELTGESEASKIAESMARQKLVNPKLRIKVLNDIRSAESKYRAAPDNAPYLGELDKTIKFKRKANYDMAVAEMYERHTAVARNKRFALLSKKSVGIGLRSAKNAGKGHNSFGSTMAG